MRYLIATSLLILGFTCAVLAMLQIPHLAALGWAMSAAGCVVLAVLIGVGFWAPEERLRRAKLRRIEHSQTPRRMDLTMFLLIAAGIALATWGPELHSQDEPRFTELGR